jgi:anthranilate phosphoribosyltransferase
LLDLAAPLTQGAHARRLWVGVGDRSRANRLAECFRHSGIERAYVVHGAGGIEPLTLAGENLVLPIGAAPGARFDADVLALPPASIGALAGGDEKRNLRLFEHLLAGENGPLCNAVVLNASAALVLAGVARTPTDGVELARATLRHGAARRTLSRWLETASRWRGAA